MAAIQAPLAKIGVLSIGQMGMGVAQLLIAKGFAVATNCKGRSEDTVDRCRRAGVENLATDSELVAACSVILSIVPPRDAEQTAQRVIDALPKGATATTDGQQSPSPPLYFADLNAVSPATAQRLAALFGRTGGAVRFVDGGILGGPPQLKAAADPGTNASRPAGAGSDDDGGEWAAWARPSIPTSGPDALADIGVYGSRLAEVLNARHISASVGAASGLKMCFASVAKGFAALAIQSFTTAHRLGVLPLLKEEMARLIPNHLRIAERSVPGVAPKAYRWIREMEEIADTHREEGGFPGPDLFMGAAGIFGNVANDSVLGEETTERRKRGRTIDDFAEALAEGLELKKKKSL